MIQTQWNKRKTVGEINNLPTLTIPDATLSIPELIKRYASGLPLEGKRIPIYDEEPETDILQGRNFQTFDLSEKHEFLTSIKNEYNETINRLRNNKPTSKRDIQEKSDNTAQELD